jgi:hypothetical protein
MEELYVNTRLIEFEVNAPKYRFRREYEQLRAIEKMEAALAGARRRFRVATSRMVSAR